MLDKVRITDISAVAILINATESGTLVKLLHDGMDVFDSFKRCLAVLAFATIISSGDAVTADDVLTSITVFRIHCQVTTVGA
jgi:hypothetical protein